MAGWHIKDRTDRRFFILQLPKPSVCSVFYIIYSVAGGEGGLLEYSNEC